MNLEEDSTPGGPEVEALVALATEPADITAQPGTFRSRTIVGGAAAVLGVAGAALGVMPVLGVVTAVVAGIGALVSFVNDLAIPSPRARGTASAAARCFAKSLKLGQWEKAHACCHPNTLAADVEIPVIDELAIRGGSMSWQRLPAFKRYWKTMFRGKGATVRLCSKVQVDEPMVEGDRAYCRATFRVVKYSAWVYLGLCLGILPMAFLYFLTRRVQSVECKLELFRSRSQWWVLPSSPYDAQGPRMLAPARARYLGA